jgi:hypothetical protein
MDVGTSFNRALERFKPNAVPLVGGFFVVAVASVLVTAIPMAVITAVVGGGLLGGMIAALVSALIGMATYGILAGGLFTMIGKTCVGAAPSFDDLLVPLKGGRTREFLIAGAVIKAPALLGIIPVVGGLLGGLLSLATAFLFFFTLIMVAEGADARTSLVRSKDMVLANIVPVIILFFVMVALSIAGVIALGVGVFVTAPIALLIYGDNYLELKGAQSQAIQAQPTQNQGGYPPA